MSFRRNSNLEFLFSNYNMGLNHFCTPVQKVQSFRLPQAKNKRKLRTGRRQSQDKKQINQEKGRLQHAGGSCLEASLEPQLIVKCTEKKYMRFLRNKNLKTSITQMKIKEECERFQHKFMQSSHERRIIKLKVLLILCIKWGPNQLSENVF